MYIPVFICEGLYGILSELHGITLNIEEFLKSQELPTIIYAGNLRRFLFFNKLKLNH